MSMHKAVCWLLLAGLLAVGCKQGTPSSGGKAETPSKGGNTGTTAGMLNAADLCGEYKAGEAAADSKHKGKEVEVHGNVSSVRPDPATKHMFLILKGASGGNVRCYFGSADEDKVKAIKGGEDVKIKGMCEGKMGGADSFDVVLRGCKLVH